MRLRTVLVRAGLAVLVMLVIHVSLNGLPDFSSLNPHA